MPLRQVSDALGTVLRYAYLGIASVIFVMAVVMMFKMDASSASQGRLYVAVIAVLLLGAVNGQLHKVQFRRLPHALTTTPAERRYAAQSLVLLVLAGAFLLQLALYLS